MKVEDDNQSAEALGERTVTSSTQYRESRYKNESEKDTPYSLHINHALPPKSLISNFSAGEQAQEKHRVGEAHWYALAAFALQLMNISLSQQNGTQIGAETELLVRRNITLYEYCFLYFCVTWSFV